MDKFSNYTLDGRFYVSTFYREGHGWETAAFQADVKSGKVDYGYALEEALSHTKDAAIATHHRILTRWSGNANQEDVLGIGEGYY